ncbi:MAG TPA: dihydrofolate reductase family protein [Saprospiraceae bacterium]|nr:dihydrofolate reductase family protein [Saprospiraceae bacterium]
MRKIVVFSFITLDGVMQAAGGPEDGFPYGGWSAPYYDDALDQIAERLKSPARDLLLGRKTYEIFASFFPQHEEIWPGVNHVTKFVVSTSIHKSNWNNTVFLKHVDDIKKLRNTEGTEIQVHGSGHLIQTLLRHDMVDELWLLIHPITLGSGMKLFNEGTMPKTFILRENFTTPSGVISAHYIRSGEVKTGVMGK